MRVTAIIAVRAVALALVLTCLGAAGGVAPVGSAWAQAERPATAAPDVSTMGKSPDQPVRARNSAEMWRDIRRGERGMVSIPDKRSGVMIQSAGEGWRAARNGPLSTYGAWLLGATLVVLLAFFLLRGRIRIEGGFSGRLVERFNNLERFCHWLTASSFIVLGLTGLNMLYGRYVVKPLIGGEAFSTFALLGKYAHDFMGFAFIAGVVLTLVIWVRDNIPNRTDFVWIAKGGGLLRRGVHPPSRRFNAGQKIIFWLVIVAGGSLSYTGLSLMFPFTFQPFSGTFAALNLVGFDLPTALSPVEEMQLTQLWHAILSLVMIAVILAHIYIGTLGMEGAFDAMGTGYVDENWAREHHSVWVDEMGIGGGGGVHARAGVRKPDV
jgi:formate dehydrogenase subunit gamma